MKREEKLKSKLLEMSTFERELHDRGIEFIAGVDEVGRGCLAGPVVSAAVVLPRDWDVLGLDDSKKLSEKKREELFDVIRDKALAYSIGMVDNETIDEINILEATKIAMKGAICSLNKKLKEEEDKCLEWILIDALRLDDIDIKQSAIIKGDSKSISIAAASILAKVTRDRLMKKMGEIYSGYAFEKNKGYGTKEHYKGLDEIGPCRIHRRTFLKKYFENKR